MVIIICDAVQSCTCTVGRGEDSNYTRAVVCALGGRNSEINRKSNIIPFPSQTTPCAPLPSLLTRTTTSLGLQNRHPTRRRPQEKARTVSPASAGLVSDHTHVVRSVPQSVLQTFGSSSTCRPHTQKHVRSALGLALVWESASH